MLRLFGRNEPASDDAAVFVSDDERLLVQQDLSPQLQREANDFYHRRDNTYRHLTRSRNDEAAQRLVFYDEANVSDEEYVVVGNQKHNGRFEESPSTSSYSLLNMERRSAPSPAPTFQPHAIHHSRVDRNANSNVAAYAPQHFSTSVRSGMRLGSRKRHVVGVSNQLAPHHPTIQAKQNQMYLITTLLPSQTDQPALINRALPKELLLRIFSYLDIVTLCRCAQTCRLWNRLAMDGSNWQRVDLFNFQKDVKASVVESLAMRCGGFLKELSLRGCENVQDSAMRSFAAKCVNIDTLSLCKCKHITDATCEYLAQNCHKLSYLDLENCTSITDDSLRFLGKGCTRLTELNISWCINITDYGIECVVRNCNNLSVLIAKGCERLTAQCFKNLNKNMDQLKKLNLLSCSAITDETVETIAISCPNLEFLCLSNCKEITDHSLNALAYNCVNLKDLELASCINLSDTGFISLSKNCHEMERMDLEDCVLITDTALVNLNTGCPNLKSLTLSHCENLTDNALAELCNSHKNCLQVLELDNCPNITDAALDYMKPVVNLERVDLFDCELITKDAIKRFKQHRPNVNVHTYFAPSTPPPQTQPARRGICKCCTIL